jgi:hypothetical protein
MVEFFRRLKRAWHVQNAIASTRCLVVSFEQLGAGPEYRAAALLLQARVLYSAGKLNQAESVLLDALPNALFHETDVILLLAKVTEELRGRDAARWQFMAALHSAKDMCSPMRAAWISQNRIPAWLASELAAHAFSKGTGDDGKAKKAE